MGAWAERLQAATEARHSRCGHMRPSEGPADQDITNPACEAFSKPSGLLSKLSFPFGSARLVPQNVSGLALTDVLARIVISCGGRAVRQDWCGRPHFPASFGIIVGLLFAPVLAA